MYEHDNCDEPNGLGYLPAPAIIGSAAGPVGTIIGVVVGVVGGLISKLFGGGDDQATGYRPPANSAEQFVHITDQHGDEYISFDVNQSTLAEAARRGNRSDDIYSYYSAFVSNSVHAGASSAARRVMEDASRTYGISISRVADWLLNASGITRIVSSFLPGQRQQPAETGAPTSLPGYCQVGTYHPYPIGHPQQDVCEPFPELSSGGQGAQRPRPTTQQPSSQRRSPLPAGGAAAAGAAAGYWLNPRAGAGGDDFSDLLANVPSSMWWLLAAAGVLIATSGGGESRGGRPRR